MNNWNKTEYHKSELEQHSKEYHQLESPLDNIQEETCKNLPLSVYDEKFLDSFRL